MKTRLQMIGVLASVCALNVFLPSRALSEIPDEEFKKLKEIVTQQGEAQKQQEQRINQLEKTHEQDLKVHEQDQQKIQELEKQLGETHAIATNAVQKAEAAAQVQPISAAAQAGPLASHNFSMVGDAEVQFGKSGSSPGTFVLADFAPIFLYRAKDNLLFEAGFDVMLQNNRPTGPGGTGSGSSTTVNLSFATMDFLYNDYVTLVAGDMLLPMGIWNERNAGWLNKIPDAPLPYQFGIIPSSGVGAQLRGAIPVGESGQTLNYSVYGVNGPSSSDGTGNAGALDLNGNVGNTPNWHGSPSGGGRAGWFYPLKPHYDFELGLSGQSGEWDDAGQHLWSAGVLDGTIHISPYFELKGEYIASQFGSDDDGLINQSGWWVQGGYKLAGLNLDWPLVNDLELISRFDKVRNALNSQATSGVGYNADRFTAGFVYYISNTFLFEADYEHFSTSPINGYVLQLSYGF